MMIANGNHDSSSEGTPVGLSEDARRGSTPETFSALSRLDLHETGPSEGTRNALGVAAEITIKGLKKVIDMAVRVTAHQPLSLSWDAIMEPADIQRILDAVGDTSTYPRSQLVLMASNTLETLPLARECRKRFVNMLTRDGVPPRRGSDAWTLAAPDSPLNQLLTILSRIENGEHEEAERLILAAVDNDSSFNHPLIADFMCSRLSDRNEDPHILRTWIRRALYFSPLDLRLIELLIAVEDPHSQYLLKQLESVAIGSDGASQ